MVAVANQLGAHLLARENGARDARSAVRDRRHAIEQVRRMPCSGVDRRHSFIYGRA